ncbi:MAG: hypothetical protein EBR82_87700 [Caulobacteraceae bacterium]|nr:hypothetical protein [Caulobacteraceae bacterium]
MNSAASGVWTLREAESLNRAGTWPLVGGPLIVFSNFYSAGGSASSEYSVSGIGTSGSPLIAVVGGNDNNDNRLWLLINQSGTLSWSLAVSSEDGYDYGSAYRLIGTPSQHSTGDNISLSGTPTTIQGLSSGSGTSSGTLAVTANQYIVLRYIKDDSIASGTDNTTLTLSIA